MINIFCSEYYSSKSATKIQLFFQTTPKIPAILSVTPKKHASGLAGIASGLAGFAQQAANFAPHDAILALAYAKFASC
jgi:hypothetical protein